MGPRPDALKAAIDEAWRVFDIPAPATTGVCIGCCMDLKIEADFLKHKARELPAEYVRDWYFAAFTDDFHHDHVAWFLPRVMELLAAGEYIAAVGQEVVFARLPQTGFPERWPKDEVDAVNRFALAFFEQKLHASPMLLEDLDSLLCMIGQGGIDIDPMLRALDALSDDELAEILHRNWHVGTQGWLRFNAFWDREPAKTMAWNWYTSDLLLARMERAGLLGNDKALAVHHVIELAWASDAP